jgi:hypothetical protein
MSEVLPSWNEGTTKQAIVDFVTRVTDEGGSDFVSPNRRIAVFDNDGTLWCEQPLPVQVYYAFDAAKEKASNDPELASREPFKALLTGDMKGVSAQGMPAIIEIVKETHTGITIKSTKNRCKPGCSRPDILRSTGRLSSWCTSRCSKFLPTFAQTDF